MFYKYEIKDYGYSSVLYLYLKLSEEFSSELTLNSNDDDLERRTKNFIKNKNINFNGDKVYLIINNIVVKVLDIKDKEKFEKYSDNYFSFKIKFDNSSTIEIKLKDFLLGCLASVYKKNINNETLKALSVLFRTYVFYNVNNYKCVNLNTHYIAYKPISFYKLLWKDKYINIYKLLIEAIDSTNNTFLSYNNNFIYPFWHYSNSGKTKTNNKYKYLSSVDSPWDVAADTFIGIKDFDFIYLNKIFNIKFENDRVLNIKYDNEGSFINISNKRYSVDYFIEKLKLPSDNFFCIIYSDNIRFITFGYGNSLGLSLFGSNELAKNGLNYLQIIHYYFPLVSINKYTYK